MLSEAKHLCIYLKINAGIVRCAHNDKRKIPFSATQWAHSASVHYAIEPARKFRVLHE